MLIDTQTSLADLVVADPRRGDVLEHFGLDYCCHGHRSLADAARAAGLDPDEVGHALELPVPDGPPAPSGTGGNTAGGNAALAHEIVDTHHAYLWREMPRLQALVEKVHVVHGERHPELAEVAATFAQVLASLDPHLSREERQVFPAITRLERSGRPDGELAGQIDTLRAEHGAVGILLTRLRTLTGGYAVPPDACASYRMMLAGLQEMEADLHQHIHKENNILFPQVLDLARQAGQGPAAG
ncbi:MAG: iron-sulfur cluster repair di-iron protein [Jatrophihabitans sp.]|nr:MAG: iron-sulfur cluster repair di-iron protein [Jatrophihabitans sp.]